MTENMARQKNKAVMLTMAVIAPIFFTAGTARADIFTDDVGRSVEVKTPVKKMVCLSPAHTEMIYAIGMENLLAGVSVQCDYPPDAVKKTKAGTFLNPDVEFIASVKPDVVISGGGIQKKAIKKMESLGIPVIVLYPQTIEAIKGNYNLLGKLTGAHKKAARESDRFSFRIEAASAEQGSRKIPVYLEMWNDPVMTVGGVSFINRALELAGGKNIFEDIAADYPKASVEEIIKRDPEAVVLLYKPTDDYMNRVYLNRTKAGKLGVVCVFDNVDIILRPGPRLPEAVMKLRHIIEKTRKGNGDKW
ncbi:MAG: ABC transporter substrate-binding protein [Spirochaetia bacterium]|nr:ABC transporter substrate-binding protein [Spirochaetia bacterium]